MERPQRSSAGTAGTHGRSHIREECSLSKGREGVEAFSMAATKTEAEEMCPLSRRTDVSQDYNDQNNKIFG